MTRLFSVGPPLWVVHEECAKRGRIGRQAPVTTAFGVDPRRGPVW